MFWHIVQTLMYRTGARITEEEWLASDDALSMLEVIRTRWRGDEDELDQMTHRYLLMCCRAIWKLLPLDASRRGIEVAERYIEGQATDEELRRASYHAEGAAFYLDTYEWEPGDESPEAKEMLVQYRAETKGASELFAKDVEAIPPEELQALVHLTPPHVDVSPRDLLMDAAYFVDTAVVYSGIRPKAGILDRHKKFLSASLLRERFGNPFRHE